MAEQPIQNTSILSNPQTLQQWLSLIEQVTGSGTTSTSENSLQNQITKLSSEASDPIKSLIATLLPGASGGMNNPQAKELLAGIFSQFREGALPQIVGMGNSAGVYNSTTQQLLANDALARAVAQGAGVVNTSQNAQQKNLIELLNLLMQSTKTSSTSTSGSKQTDSSKGPSGAGSALGKLAAGGAAAAAAKRALDSLVNKVNNRQGPQSKGDQEGDYPQFGAPGEGEFGVPGNKGDQEGDYPTEGVRGLDGLDRAGLDFGESGDLDYNSGNGEMGDWSWDISDFLTGDTGFTGGSDGEFDFLDGPFDEGGAADLDPRYAGEDDLNSNDSNYEGDEGLGSNDFDFDSFDFGDW